MRVYCDTETYSAVPITSGVYSYAGDPSFRLLMCAWSVDGGPVTVDTDLDDVLRHLNEYLDAGATLVAHNANFDRVVLSAALGLPVGSYLPPDQWECTVSIAAELGLPQHLKDLALALGGEQKDEAGKRLIRLFCVPNKAGGRNLPQDYPDEWAEMISYCAQDVRTLVDVDKTMGGFPTPTERRTYHVDQRVNDRGLAIDRELAEAAVTATEDNRMVQELEFATLTGVANPGSNPQVLKWLRESGLPMTDMQAATVQDALAGNLTDVQRRALELRQDLALVAAKKYPAALASVSGDGRLRGGFRFFGAHTGRWSGRGVQPHNLPRAGFKDPVLEEAAIVDLKLGLGADSQTLKMLVRALLVGPFTVVDYAQIEARVLAWMANERWALKAFNDGRDIYVETAGRMSTPGNALTRAQGKVAVLALGYNGGVNSLRAMGAEGSDNTLQLLVDQWRWANPAIAAAWNTMGQAFRSGGPVGTHLSVEKQGRDRLVRLPSGRAITYRDVRWTFDESGRQQATFADARGRAKTYGGRLIENCLAGDSLVLTQGGWTPITEVGGRQVWDGLEWVKHEGARYNGTRQTIVVDGVRMTGDHRVLTTDGWTNASSCGGHHRAQVRLPDGAPVRGVIGAEVPLGDPLRLRGRADPQRVGHQASTVLRVPDAEPYRGIHPHPRDVPAPGLLGVALDGGSLQAPHSSGVAQLRRARDLCLRAVVRLYDVLGGHGADVPAGADAGSERQRGQLLPQELPLGYPQGERQEQAEHAQVSDVLGNADCRGDQREDRDRCQHPLDADPERGERIRVDRATGRQEPVYDLFNCGPRNRFVVLGADGPLIVHNCTQAIARDILAEALVRLEDGGFEVVGHVHDECLVEGGSVDEVVRIMTDPPGWAAGLPIDASGFVCARYRK